MGSLLVEMVLQAVSQVQKKVSVVGLQVPQGSLHATEGLVVAQIIGRVVFRRFTLTPVPGTLGKIIHENIMIVDMFAALDGDVLRH